MAGTRTALLASSAMALVALALGLAADVYFRNGVVVSWRAVHEGELVEVDRTIEHRVSFPNEHRATARYVQGWDFDAWGVPDRIPDLDARITGRLTVPEGEPLLVRAHSPNGHDLLIDGLRSDAPIEPGTHELALYWHGPMQPPGAERWEQRLPVSVELLWGADEEVLEPVPRSAIDLPVGTSDPARTALWSGIALLCVFAFGAVWACLRAVGRSAVRRATVAATAGILLLGLGLRLYDYDVMPEFRENIDELFATWNGWQLLEDGTTRGWTIWPARYVGLAHIERVEYFRERPIPVVTPYFEHPPLLHLLAGAAAHFGGAEDSLHAKLRHTRLVPIALGGVTLLLLVLLGRRLDPHGPAPYLAGLLYATLPHAVLMNRVIKEEALLAPLLLASLLFFLRWRDGGERTRDLVAAGVLAGLCTLTKVPGLAFVVTLGVLVAPRGFRAAAIAVGAGTIVSALLLVYGAAIDWELFWYVTRDQATMRGPTWQQFAPFFFDSLINHNHVGRSWLLFLWLAFVASALLRDVGRRSVLTVPTVGYLVAIGLGSGSWHYGWYILPIEPLLCIGAGIFLADLWRRPDLLRAALFILLPVAYGMAFLYDWQWAHSQAAFPYMRRWTTLFTIGMLLPFGLVHLKQHTVTLLAARTATVVAVALAVMLNAFFVVRYETLYETYHAYDGDPRGGDVCGRCDELRRSAADVGYPADVSPSPSSR